MLRVLIFSLSLVLVCGSLYAQRPDNAGRRNEIRPNSASGRGQAGGSTNQANQGSASAGQSSAARQNGSGRGEHGPIDQDTISGQGQRGQSLSRGRSDERQTNKNSRENQHANNGRGRGANDVKPHLTGQQRALQTQLAAVDRMRDKAVETGNQEMLDKADLLEKRIRERFPGVTLPDEEATADATTEDDLPGVGQSGGNGKARHMNAGTNGKNAFGKTISGQARQDGRAFGETTSNQAQADGRAFGRSNADKTRFQTPITPPPTEPIDDGETEATPEPGDDGGN